MSQLTWKQQFASDFFAAWSGAVDGLDAVYTSPSGVVTPIRVLVDIGTDQFGDDLAPVSAYDVHLVFLLAEVVPEQGGTVNVDGTTYTLAQRLVQSHSGIDSDEVVSVWGVQS
jgi:hypothetical protein